MPWSDPKYQLPYIFEISFYFSRFSLIFHRTSYSFYSKYLNTTLIPVYQFYFPLSASFLIVPICLSLRVSRPSLFLIVPGGSPCFFSNVPTVQSLLVFLISVSPLSRIINPYSFFLQLN